VEGLNKKEKNFRKLECRTRSVY